MGFGWNWLQAPAAVCTKVKQTGAMRCGARQTACSGGPTVEIQQSPGHVAHIEESQAC